MTFQRGVPAVFRRSELDALGWHGTSLMKATRVESICCVPIVASNGKLGTLFVGRTKPDEFSESDVTLLGHTSAQIAIAIENARAYQRVMKLNAQLIDEKQYLEGELQNEFADIVAISPAVRRILKAVETVAPTDTTVLLLGETGTGKELIARALHNLSPRRAHTFVRTSVVALPSSLLESELLATRRAPSPAQRRAERAGWNWPTGGRSSSTRSATSPGRCSPSCCASCRSASSNGLAASRTQHVDVRIVAATNRDLERMVDDGSFRSDLYYRLNVFPITIPPLRDRLEDIAGLARHFVAQYARRIGRTVPVISDRAMDALKSWNWPGNIRELQNVIERAVILTSGPGGPAVAGNSVANQAACGSPGPTATFKDAERRNDPSRIEGLRRRDRGTGGRRLAPRPQTNHAPVQDAEARDPPAFLLTIETAPRETGCGVNRL